MTVSTTPTPGIYRGLTAEQYWALDAVNHSALKVLEYSPSHFRYLRSLPQAPTEPLVLGDAIHAAVLEPERFSSSYFAGPDCPRVKVDDKKRWADALEANPGKEPLRPAEYASALRIRDLMLGHEILGPALRFAREKKLVEVTAVWEDADTGILCKCRVDLFGRLGPWPALFDLKSTMDASASGFARSIARFWYHTQAAFYLQGFATLSPADRRFVFAAVEKCAPWESIRKPSSWVAVQLHELNEADLEIARIAIRRWMRTIKRCTDTGEWPGYPERVNFTSLPKYAQRWDDESEEEEE